MPLLGEDIIKYINQMENITCGEFCNATYPYCNEERHDEAKELIRRITERRGIRIL